MSDLTQDFVTLRGLIVPAQWDKNGNITGIAVSCFDEEEYQVLMDENSGGLMDFLHRRVEIVGQWSWRNRTKTVKVKAFNINDWKDLIDEKED